MQTEGKKGGREKKGEPGEKGEEGRKNQAEEQKQHRSMKLSEKERNWLSDALPFPRGLTKLPAPCPRGSSPINTPFLWGRRGDGVGNAERHVVHLFFS